MTTAGTATAAASFTVVHATAVTGGGTVVTATAAVAIVPAAVVTV